MQQFERYSRTVALPVNPGAVRLCTLARERHRGVEPALERVVVERLDLLPVERCRCCSPRCQADDAGTDAHRLRDGSMETPQQQLLAQHLSGLTCSKSLVDMRLCATEPPPRQPREKRRYARLSAEESGRDHDADPRDHDADLGDQSADPADHDEPIRTITMRRSSRARWRVTRSSSRPPAWWCRFVPLSRRGVRP